MDEFGFNRPAVDFKPGGRVELSPATDRWMMGDRFGKVTSVKGDVVYVQLDRSGKRLPFKTRDIRFAKG